MCHTTTGLDSGAATQPPYRKDGVVEAVSAARGLRQIAALRLRAAGKLGEIDVDKAKLLGLCVRQGGEG